MDVLTFDRSSCAPAASGAEGEPALGPLARPRTALFAEIARRAPGGTGSREDVRRGGLLAYTASSIALGLGLLAWTTATVPVAGAIDPKLPGTAVGGTGGGLLLWVMFGLLGSLRVLRAPGGGAFFTFHLPFVGAAMVLGGPTAGAWVAFLSTIERRELESQPWYGILANHSVMVVGAVAGGVATSVLVDLLGAPGLASGPGFAATVAGTLVLTVATTGIAAVTVVLRDELSPRAFLELLVGQFGRITSLEIALAWVLCMAYLVVGWWAPLAIGVFVLLAWDNHPMPAPDALTTLHAAEGFGRRMEGGLGRLRRGLTPGAAMLSIDLDYFKTVNDRFGHPVGDEVLAAVGARLRAQARRPTDLAGRLGGDEFALFLPGLSDTDTAMRRAEDVFATITAPIPTTAGPITVGASIGVMVLESWGGVPAAGTVLRHADQAMYRAKRAGGGTHLFSPGDPGMPESGCVDNRR
jgi:diguanylate cyclase (GGDEF)-like protein